MLSGCATFADKEISKRIKIGMTQDQVYSIAGHPVERTRQVIDGHIYETWHCYILVGPFDFVDGILTGYNIGYIYHSKDKIDNAEKSYKNFAKTPFPINKLVTDSH